MQFSALPEWLIGFSDPILTPESISVKSELLQLALHITSIAEESQRAFLIAAGKQVCILDVRVFFFFPSNRGLLPTEGQLEAELHYCDTIAYPSLFI